MVPGCPKEKDAGVPLGVVEAPKSDPLAGLGVDNAPNEKAPWAAGADVVAGAAEPKLKAG